MQKLEIDANTWAQLNQLLDAALDQPAAQREQWLAALAPQFDSLQPHLRSLLSRAAQIETDDFLNTLPKIGGEPGEDAIARQPTGEAGASVGPYRLVRELGTGGMGSVWLAERSDGLIDRPVALKLPHGLWRSAGLAERMAREREILATLNHPHIARLYDAGVAADDQPYLALEYVEGRAIDEYCRDRQLDLKARLQLFTQVAHAVAYAHGKLVVHRDLKPANILVTADGQVRLLDFGIAKLTEEGQAKESRLTELSGRALTPDYASPEQILGESLTVASDVYSLGVVLYELLTAARPYRLKRDSRGALEDAILQAQPGAPSDGGDVPWRKALRGDLDTIVLKALKKKPEERYTTVHALLDDIERYLGARPVLAQPDGSFYRLAKFIVRNKVAVSAAAAIFITVLAGASVALWQAQVAIAERQRAEEVKEFIASIFAAANPYGASGGTLSALDLLKQAQLRIDLIDASRSDLRVEMLGILGAGLLALQDTDTAEKVLLQAVDEADRSMAFDHPAALYARLELLSVHRFRGRAQQMREELTRLSAPIRSNADERPADLVRMLRDRAHLEIDAGAYPEAIAAAREARELAMRRLGARHLQTISTTQVLALAHVYAGEAHPALELAKQALDAALLINGGNSRHPLVINTRSTYSRALALSGDIAQAIRELEQASEDAREVFGPDNRMFGFFSQMLVKLYLQTGRISAAQAHAEIAVRILSKHVQSSSFTYAAAVNARGNTFLAARDGARAVPDLTEAIASGSAAMGKNHPHIMATRVNRALALAYAGRTADAQADLRAAQAGMSLDANRSTWLFASGVTHRLAGDHDKAMLLQRQALQLIGSEPNSSNRKLGVLAQLGFIELDSGRLATALPLFQQAQGWLAEPDAMTPEHADVLLGLGRLHLAQSRYLEALAALERADSFWLQLNPESRWSGEVSLWLGKCYLALGRKAQAAEAFSRAKRILAQSPVAIDAALLKLAP